MRTQLLGVAIISVLVMGCSNRDKEDQLQRQVAEGLKDQESLQQTIADKDKYVNEIVQAVNDIYKDLERTRVKEGKLAKRAQSPDATPGSVNTNPRGGLLANISEIGTTLKENRKRIGDLQLRVKRFRGQIASLDSLVASLKTSLEDREQSIAQLQARVQGLESTVAEKVSTIQANENVINKQQHELSTALYVVGTRDELKEKGIITDEGGFLWGLLGSTTVMSSGVDPTEFTPIDKTTNQTIHVDGKIDEILPKRQENYFALSEPGENSSDLAIVSPDKFWQDKYLVIVVDR